jgi:hypothetical protein
MPLDTDEIDHLVGELGASLGSQYSAFVAAAHAALGNCSGPGAAYRILRDLQKSFFEPPPEATNRYAPRHFRPNKHADLQPLAEDSARGRRSAKSRWLRGWRG